MMIKNNGKTYIIAEVGVNHNGDPALAKKLIKEAKMQVLIVLNFRHLKLLKLLLELLQKRSTNWK